MKRFLACLPFCLQIIGGYKTFDGGENDSNSHIEQHYSGSASHSAVMQTLRGLLIIFSFAHLGDGKTLGLLINVTDYHSHHL